MSNNKRGRKSLDQVTLDGHGPVPTYTISMEGLAHINFDFKLFDSSGSNQAAGQQGVNTAKPESTFHLDVIPIAGLNGRILSLMGVAADFRGGICPYDVTVTVRQAENSTAMTIHKPSMTNGAATFFGSVRFDVQ